MAVRDDFAPGEVLAAADLNDTFASKLPYSFGTATPSTSVDGFLWYDENDTPPTPKFWDGAAFQSLTSGKILQVVRATDTTNRTTTSTSYVDAGISVTITPKKSDSAILLIWNSDSSPTSSAAAQVQLHAITDNSNNFVSAEVEFGVAVTNTTAYGLISLIGYATPATTSAVSYKGRYKAGTGVTARIRNATLGAGQLYAIEVSA